MSLSESKLAVLLVAICCSMFCSIDKVMLVADGFGSSFLLSQLTSNERIYKMKVTFFS
jgi:hypothetical protein